MEAFRLPLPTLHYPYSSVNVYISVLRSSYIVFSGIEIIIYVCIILQFVAFCCFLELIITLMEWKIYIFLYIYTQHTISCKLRKCNYIYIYVNKPNFTKNSILRNLLHIYVLYNNYTYT